MELAPIYEAFASRGIDALVVDRMEIWQVAASLGQGKDTDGGSQQSSGEDRARFLMRERMAGRKPAVRPMGAGIATIAVQPGVQVGG